ncbi:MAG: DUF4105 domain-containing protein [Candidatus Moraniibacteriota bacterium]|jgi:uncharacterized protein DUF4105
MKKVGVIILSILIVVATMGLASMTRTPNHDRSWELGHDKLPQIQISGDNITIQNMRDFTWNVDGGADGKYITDKFKLSEMDSVDVIISHFDDFHGLAHIFITFGFENDEYIVVSVETRREENEAFSPWTGLLNKFELIYVVGTERDIIGTRTNVRGEKVYLYNVDAEPKTIQKLFKLIAEDINVIYDTPKFYNTLSWNCINAITRRVEDVADVNFPVTYKMLLPGFVDEVLYDMEIIRQKGTFEEIEMKAEIDNDRVDRDSEDFSNQIRTQFKTQLSST